MSSQRVIGESLSTATSVGDVEWVKEILKQSDSNAFLNKSNKGGWTSLMYAAYYGHEDILEILLENGADVNVRNKQCQTSLMLCAMCGHENCCLKLLQYRARVDDRDERSWTSLVYAISSGYQPVVSLLIKNGANVNVVMVENRITPIFFAASSGLESIARLLIEAGANLNIKTTNNQTPSMLARENGHTHLAYLLETNFISKQNDLKLETSNPYTKIEANSNTKSPVSAFLSDLPYPKDLAELLDSLGLIQYLSLFEEKNIDLNSFLHLKEENLKLMGITKLGPKRKMAIAITKINEAAILATRNNTMITSNSVNGSLKAELVLEKNSLPPGGTSTFDVEQLLSVLNPLISVQLKNIQLKDNINSLKTKIGSKKTIGGMHFNEINEDLIETERLNNEMHIELTSILRNLDDIAGTKSFK